jgi:hypothetical protein
MRFEVARKLMVHAEDVNELEHPERPGYTWRIDASSPEYGKLTIKR